VSLIFGSEFLPFVSLSLNELLFFVCPKKSNQKRFIQHKGTHSFLINSVAASKGKKTASISFVLK
jgi:hypothetical protein